MRVPEGWAKMKIGDLCLPDSEQVLVAPGQTYKLMGVRWYGNGPHLHSEVLGENLNTSTLNLIKEGRVTYNKMWVSKSAFGITSADQHGMYATSEYPTFLPRPSLCLDFLKHYMKLESFRVQALSRCRGTTSRARLNPKDFLSLEILLPPLFEQHRIAEALTDVDKAIEATQTVIEQTRKVKQGVMKSLLTRGIGHREFKQTELGEIPQTWQVVQISEIVSPEGILTGPFGTALSANDFVDSGVPVLRIGNVRESHIDTEKLLYVSPKKAKTLTRYSVRANDILFARQGATTGRNCLVSQEHSGWLINYHIIRLRIDASIADPRYVYFCLNSLLVKSQVSEKKSKGNRDGINCSQIAGFRIPLPPILETEEISDVLDSFIVLDQEYHKKLQQLLAVKHTLMSDLLTGRKRVSADALSPAL